MAGLYTQMNLVPDALRQWDLWLSAHPHSAARGRVLNGRCWLRTRLKLDLPQALEDCKQAVALDGSNANIRDSLGWTYLRLGDLARAVEAFDGGIKLYGKLALSYYGRGKAFRLLGNAEQAQRDLRVARILDPQIDDKVKSEGFEPEPLPSGKAVD
jgi:tetratricopeptide (TPR) repeat protein